MCGGHSCSKSSVMHNGSTRKYTQGHNHHTNEQSMSVRGYSPIFSKKKARLFILPLYICNVCTNIAKAPTWPWSKLFFMHISQAKIDPDIYELGLT